MGRNFDRLTATMRSLCYQPSFVSVQGDSPAALGNRIGAAAIAFGRSDGSLERQHYIDPSYVPVNEPLVVSQPGATMHDRTFWQPLAFGQIVIQGGLAIPAKTQSFVGSQWGHVRSFALPVSKKGLPIDPGPAPLGDPTSATYKQAALNVIRSSSRSKGAAIAARWAGPEGSPGRWNAIANAASDSERHGLPAAERLAWDVKLDFALNGALQDAAVATWGAKRTYQSVRPISMIRELAFQGQSSDRHQSSFSADGLPLVPGLVELITKESSAAGQRHAALATHVGDIAIRTARGWTLGTRWLPRAGIVTPPSPSWVSDQSAFGHAAAEILTAMTRSGALPAHAGGLPAWGTYRRAADEAGLSGVYAGTQIAADDVAGRRLGSTVGKHAFALAERYFAGTVR
jgi:hypothetical protein